jgi:hypothetical protein
MSPRLLHQLTASRTQHAFAMLPSSVDASAGMPPDASAQSRRDSQLQGRPPEPRGPLPRGACAWFDGCDMGPIRVTVP